MTKSKPYLPYLATILLLATGLAPAAVWQMSVNGGGEFDVDDMLLVDAANCSVSVLAARSDLQCEPNDGVPSSTGCALSFRLGDYVYPLDNTIAITPNLVTIDSATVTGCQLLYDGGIAPPGAVQLSLDGISLAISQTQLELTVNSTAILGLDSATGHVICENGVLSPLMLGNFEN